MMSPVDSSHRESLEHPAHSPSLPSAGQREHCIEVLLPLACWSWNTDGRQFNVLQQGKTCFCFVPPLSCLVQLVCTTCRYSLCVLSRLAPTLTSEERARLSEASCLTTRPPSSRCLWCLSQPGALAISPRCSSVGLSPAI